MSADSSLSLPLSGTHRYRVTHRTEYRYSDVVTSSYGRGFLTPRNSLRQRCVAHRLTIDPAPADRSTSRDGYGNISSYFHVTEPHRTLTITSDSIVDVSPPPPGLYTSGPALQPWEAARPAGLPGSLATEFTLDLNPPEITDAVREYAAPSFLPKRPWSRYCAISRRGSTPTSPTARVPRRFPQESTRCCWPAKGYAKISPGWRSPAYGPTVWRPVMCRATWPPTRRPERIG